MKDTGTVQVQRHSFLTLVLCGSEWSNSCHPALLQGNNLQCPWNRWSGGLQSLSVHFGNEKNLSLPWGNETLFSPQPDYFTDTVSPRQEALIVSLFLVHLANSHPTLPYTKLCILPFQVPEIPNSLHMLPHMKNRELTYVTGILHLWINFFIQIPHSGISKWHARL
jgi:hypothetical protein